MLARLPDTAELTGNRKQHEQSEASEFVDYRFDMPNDSNTASSTHASHSHAVAAPHMLRQFTHGEGKRRSTGTAAQLLPNTDPFAFPTTGTLERLAPIARFLTLFLLFTAVGTFMVANMRVRKPTNSPDAQAPAAITPPAPVPLLEPASTTTPPKIAAPTAFGPLGAKTESVEDQFDDFPDLTTQLDVKPPSTRIELGMLPYVRVSEPAAVAQLSETNTLTPAPVAPPQPQYITGDTYVPPIARLPGIIEEVPQQANHDTHQPRIY